MGRRVNKCLGQCHGYHLSLYVQNWRKKAPRARWFQDFDRAQSGILEQKVSTIYVSDMYTLRFTYQGAQHNAKVPAQYLGLNLLER